MLIKQLGGRRAVRKLEKKRIGRSRFGITIVLVTKAKSLNSLTETKEG